MSKSALLDTSYLITLFNDHRDHHEDAKQYYRYFLDHDVELLLPSVVVAEFCLKQPLTDLPLRNFRILPFNRADAEATAALNVAYYRTLLGNVGQRDAVKDDFKIIAQSKVENVDWLVTHDADTLVKYAERLRLDGQISFKIINLAEGYDESRVNLDGQHGLGIP